MRALGFVEQRADSGWIRLANVKRARPETMYLEAGDDIVVIRLTRPEAARLAVGLKEAALSLSRAEYYIRTGLSALNVKDVADALFAAS